METFTAKIDQRGRIYLPIRLRRALNLKPGDQVEWEIYENYAVMRKAKDAVQRTFNRIAR
jgi:AbrB family looped-hinge helix DNA binding protein